MENKLEKELNSIAQEIKELSGFVAQLPDLTNKLEQIKFGLNVKTLQSLKDSFFRFYPLANEEFLSTEAKELFKKLSEEKTELNQLLKSLESPSEDILKMLDNGYKKN